jgi:hypothetical protein
MKKLAVLIVLALLAALIPTQIAGAACGVVASGTLTGPNTVPFGPFVIPAGSTVSVRVTNTSAVQINYTVNVIIGGIPFSNSGTVDAGETETASASFSATVSASATISIDGGSVNYVGRINCPGGAGGGADEEEAPPPPPSDGRLPGSGTEAVVYAEDDGIEFCDI